MDFAYNAKETFKEKLTSIESDRRAVSRNHPGGRREESPVKTFADLKGKKVGVGAPGSGTEANFVN